MKTKNILLIISIIALASFVFVYVYDLSNVEKQRQRNQQINHSELLPGQPVPPRPEDQVIRVPLSGVFFTMGLIVLAFYFVLSLNRRNPQLDLLRRS